MEKRDICKMSLFWYTNYINVKEETRMFIYNITIKRSAELQ